MSAAARGETCVKPRIVAMIAIHNTMISAKAAPGDFHPKKIHNHKPFRTSWITKSAMDRFRTALLEFHAFQAATAIKKYKVVHTGPNNQFGGFHDGFRRVGYQVLSALAVGILPTPAVAKQRASQRTSANGDCISN